MGKHIVAVVGAYRSGKVIDTVVSQIAQGVESEGGQMAIVHLRDRNVAFCTNCRSCTQTSPEAVRGECPTDDDMAAICDQLEAADAIVFASPINFGTITALMKRFVERLICYAYWPWASKRPPRQRIKKRNKKALLVTSSAAPALMAKYLMPGALRPMKLAAACLGAKVVDIVYVGMVPAEQDPTVPKRTTDRAYRAGATLARQQA
ncbi:MAG: flavodoxin family protein [Phycisphaerae bacterium]|nr:flavodoxin family protein [Phycisphaerae bacterium]